MISKEDRESIVETAHKYKASRVLLFGSGADPKREARDIDLGVEGVPPKDFFQFYGELIFKLSKPVDIVDLAEKSKFTLMILRDGVPLYG